MGTDCAAPCERNAIQILKYQLQNLCEKLISICVRATLEIQIETKAGKGVGVTVSLTTIRA